MSAPHFQSITDQVAAYLREELLRGRWSGEMPGQHQLVKLLGVSRKTVELAQGQLEKEGLLEGQGAGRRRRVVVPKSGITAPGQRIAILLYEQSDAGADYHVDLDNLLKDVGHVRILPAKSLQEMGMDAKRVAQQVQKTEADAWIVCAGSREVLEWFSRQSAPVFALFGRRRGLPIAGAGPDKVPALRAAIERLVGFGHRRIVKIVREERRQPVPGHFEQSFLDELSAHNITPSSYNLPDWDGTHSGLHRILDSLFGLTPPTALVISEGPLFIATQLHLAQRGITAPNDVSLVCTDPDPVFAWCEPAVSHIEWKYRPVMRCALRWANNVARGKDDRRQSFTKAEFVEGGTVGPAPKGK